MNDASPFNLDKFIQQLRSAAQQTDARAQVKRIVQEAVSDPETVRQALPDYAEDDVVLYEDEQVSIWHCRFQPGLTVPPHDHQMTATIGVYQGAERNRFYTRNADGKAQHAQDKVLAPGDVLQFGPTAIHAVASDSPSPTCGFHVYLGKLTTVERSLFDPESGEEMPFTDEAYEQLVAR